MPKKTKRRPFRRPNIQQRKEDTAEQRRRLESAAQALLATRSPEQLQQELVEHEMLLNEADQAAQLDPNPASLSRYRFAASRHQAIQAAVKLANNGA